MLPVAFGVREPRIARVVEVAADRLPQLADQLYEPAHLRRRRDADRVGQDDLHRLGTR